VNQKKNYLTTPKESGFTLVEVIVAVAILSFAIFATLRVITASLNSITRQGQRVKALHLAQAHLAKLEAESFSNVVPEIWTIDSTTYQLNIYDDNIPASQIFIATDNNDWYNVIGFNNDGNDDGILVVEKNGTITFTQAPSSPPSSGEYLWTQSNLTLTFSDSDVGTEVQIYYRYYHLVEEGGTVPSDGEAGEEGIVRLVTDPGDLNNIVVEETDSGDSIPPDEYSSSTRELFFNASDEGKSVWIYYLPQKTTDSDGDDYDDPANNSILGAVEGSFCNPDGSIVPQITNTKKVTVTEYWKQGKDIQRTEQETYITR